MPYIQGPATLRQNVSVTREKRGNSPHSPRPIRVTEPVSEASRVGGPEGLGRGKCYDLEKFFVARALLLLSNKSRVISFEICIFLFPMTMQLLAFFFLTEV